MEAQRPHPPVRSALDRLVVLVAYLVLGAVTLLAPLEVGFSGMRTTGCAGACDYSLVELGGGVIIFGTIGVTVVALLALLLLARPDRLLWWLPCSALVVAPRSCCSASTSSTSDSAAEPRQTSQHSARSGCSSFGAHLRRSRGSRPARSSARRRRGAPGR